jgi:C-terminal processing protease CtpA/Prc
MKRLAVPVLLIVFISLACQIGFNPPFQPTPTAAVQGTPVQLQPTSNPQATLTPQASPTQAVTVAPLPTLPGAATITPTSLPATPIVMPAGGQQPSVITGSFTYTNTFEVETLFVEQAVALEDMHGFVIRNPDWVLPLESQVLGYLKIDTQKKRGDYRLQLPEIPAGTYTDFTNSGGKKPGVQIFAVAYQPNATGGPFSEGDDPTRGWPTYLGSVVTDSANKDEVVGGKLVVWAPDAQEMFPSGYGPDGLLFTADDPLGALPAGYSIIDLDQKPFAIDRSLNPQLTLYEPNDVAIKDYSKLSYSQAFQNMFDTLKVSYAFNGISGKEPAWDKLYADIMPRVKAAEQAKDPEAYYVALLDFTLGFKDGHVDVNGGDPGSAYRSQQIAGGYGFAIRVLDDGSAIAAYVTPQGPADTAGMKAGAVITQFNGLAIKDAISQAKIFSPQSSDFALLYQQARYLTRAPLGTTAKVTFQNSGAAAQTVSLKATNETRSFAFSSLFRDYDPNALPVEYRILDSGDGYIKVNSNEDDINLIYRIFQRALTTFRDNQVDHLIIDMRTNPGGTPLGLAGFLTNRTIPLGTLEYYSSKTGKFEPEGSPQVFQPLQEQFHFAKIALLVDQSCFSACELEAYGFSKVSGVSVVGMYPTGGVEAEVSRGQFMLPEGMQAQFPTGRFVLPDGSIFLEGKGVQPTLRVPITAENVLSQNDVVLQAAENLIQ